MRCDMKVRRIAFLYVVLASGGLLPGAALGGGMLESYPVGGAFSASSGLQDPPLFADEQPVFDQRKQLLAVKWQHRLNEGEGHSLTFSAGYGDDVYLEETEYESVSTMAELSWAGKGAGRLHPSLTGSLFVGDADTRDDAYQHLDHKYFGFALGGRVTLAEKHSPYVSFKMLRSDYDSGTVEDPLASSPEISRLTAGWDWQVRPNWRLRAEADYTLDNFSLDLDRYDRSRVFFSTRFDFR